MLAEGAEDSNAGGVSVLTPRWATRAPPASLEHMRICTCSCKRARSGAPFVLTVTAVWGVGRDASASEEGVPCLIRWWYDWMVS